MTVILLLAALTLQTPDLTCRVRGKDESLVRSRSRVCLFLRTAGYLPKGAVCRVPDGKRVDHLVPLACGGCDVPSNMALLSTEEHAAKSRWERQPCSSWWDGTHARAIHRAGHENVSVR